MTWFRINLWSGAGYGLDTFTAEGSSLLDAVESISGVLAGTPYVVTPDGFDEVVESFTDDDTPYETALEYANEQYAPLDDGNYLFTLNMTVEEIPGPFGVRCSRCGYTVQDDLMANSRCPICGGTMRLRGTGVKSGKKNVSWSLRRASKPVSKGKPKAKTVKTKEARR